MSPDDKIPPPQPLRPQPPRPQAPRPQPPKPPPRAVNPADDPQRAEQRMREEMARQRNQEDAHLEAMKFGCIGIIVVLILAMVIAFLV